MNPRILLCVGGVLLTATAALILVGPQPLAGQTGESRSAISTTNVVEPFPESGQQPSRYQPAGIQPHQSSGRNSEPRRFAGPFGRRAMPTGTPQAVQQVQGTHSGVSAPQAETAIQRELRELYEKNGKQMPEMNMQNLPKSAQGMRGVQTRDLQQNASAPNSTSSNSRFGFLKKLFPFGRSSTEEKLVAPPQNRAYNQPAYSQPGNRRPVYRAPQYAQPNHVGTIPAQPVRSTVIRQPAAPVDPDAPPLLFSDAPNRPAPNTVAPKFPDANPSAAVGSNDVPLLIDDRYPNQQQPKVQATPPKTNAGSFSPFPDGSESEADGNRGTPAKTQAAPSGNAKTPVINENPFTGQKLTDEGKIPVFPTEKAEEPTARQPAVIAPDANAGANPFAEPSPQVGPQPKTEVPVITQQKEGLPTLEIQSAQQIREAQEAEKKPAKVAVKQDVGKVTLKPEAPQQPTNSERKSESKADKIRRIAERSGMSGFRGFCPVVLRNQRELADAKPEFHATYEGKTYFLSSAVAKIAFDKQPQKYAPANAGHDVIAALSEKNPVEGSLQHAVWFRDRLYFFSTAETLKTFSRNPKQFAPAE